MISIVVATDKNGVIGRENKIPWRIRDDLVRLKTLTLGHTVILGRVTYDSMSWYYDKSGRPMPGKVYIIVTRNRAYKSARDNTRVVHSIEEAVKTAEELGDEKTLVVGGSEVFREMLPLARRIYLTEVQTKAEGDAVFPQLNPKEWQEASREHRKKDERNEFDFDLVILERT